VTWDAAEAEAPPRIWNTALAMIAAVVMLLIYSAAWQLPLFGDKPDPAAAGLARTAYLPAYALAFLLILARPWNTARVAARQPFLLLLMGIVVASIAWSVAPNASIRHGFAAACTTIAGLALAAGFRWIDLSRLLGIVFAVLVVASYGVCLAAPSIAVVSETLPGGWRGLWMAPGTLGGLMALGCCVLSATALMDADLRKLWLAFAGLAAGLVLMSRSGAGLAALAVGLTALSFVWACRRGATRGATVVGVLLLVLFMLLAASTLLGKEAVVTGRTPLWATALSQIEQRPWLGYGYGASAGQSVRNAWIELWLGVGLFGLMAWGLFYLQALALAVIAAFRDSGALLAFPVLAAFTLVSLTESVAMADNDLRWVVFVAAAGKLAFSDRVWDG